MARSALLALVALAAVSADAALAARVALSAVPAASALPTTLPWKLPSLPNQLFTAPFSARENPLAAPSRFQIRVPRPAASVCKYTSAPSSSPLHPIFLDVALFPMDGNFSGPLRVPPVLSNFFASASPAALASAATFSFVSVWSVIRLNAPSLPTLIGPNAIFNLLSS